MKSKLTLLGHPVHQMVIVFPLGLLVTTSVFDGLRLATRKRGWSKAASYTLSAGLTSGIAAAIPGLVDYLDIPDQTRARRIGLWHGAGNLLVTSLFAASWLARRRNPANPSATAVALSAGGAGLAMVTAWLGGELVDRLGVGVHEGANLNAPSSLNEGTAELLAD